MIKIIVWVGCTLVAAGIAYALRIAWNQYAGERSDFERWPRHELSAHPERTGIAGLHEIAFGAVDTPRLAGWYAPSRNRAAVVLVHGTAADRASLLVETGDLADAGFGVLALDLPGQGGSEGKTLWGSGERRAISAAVDWLSGRAEVDPRRIGGFGLSMGAYVLTQAAVLDTRLRAVVLAACPADVVEQNWVASNRWGLLSQLPTIWALRASGMPLDMLPKHEIGKIAPRAVLLIAGEDDHAVPAYMAQQLFEAARDPKELWMVSGARHGDYARVQPREYRERLTGFFGRTLLS